MKNILSIVLVSIAIIACVIGFIVPVAGHDINIDTAEVVTTISEDSYIPSEEIETVEIETVVIREPSLEELRANGYTDESIEIQDLKKQWTIAHARYNEYKEKYNEKWLNSDEFWAQKYEENPTGTYIWKYMKDLGYSDAVCAGIFGNMMLECGIEEAGSFDLKWWVYDSSTWFYGLCQWSKTYFPEVYGADLEGQMNCLRDTIKEQIDEAGFVYGGYGFGYEEFLQLEDPAEVAVCFAKAYERCAAQHVWPRRDFAEQAYEYFTN